VSSAVPVSGLSSDDIQDLLYAVVALILFVAAVAVAVLIYRRCCRCCSK